MSEVNAFNRKALEGKSNRDWLSNYTSSSGSSVSQLYNQAKSENAATADEVDRTSSDSSGTSTVQEITSWATLAMSLVTTGVQVYQAFSGKGGSGSGSGSASGGTASTGGDPLTALTNATNAYQASQTKQNLQTLVRTISTASSVRDGLKQGIDAQEKKITELDKLRENGQAKAEECADYLNAKGGIVDQIKTNAKIITNTQTKIDTNQAALAEFDSKIKEKQQAKYLNAEAINKQKDVVTNNEIGVSEAGQAVTQTTAAQTQAQDEQDQYIVDYSEAKSKESGLKSAWDTAKDNLEKASKAIGNLPQEISNLEGQIKSDKKIKLDVSSREHTLENKKTALKQAKENLEKAKKEEKAARKAYEDNQEQIKDLEGKIKVGETTLAKIKTELETLQNEKATAEQKLNTASSELKGFIDEDAVIGKAFFETKLGQVKAKDNETEYNLRLAESINDETKLTASQINVEEATITIQNQINQINTALGQESDTNTARGKLAQYNQALSRAESVRNLDFSSDLMTGGEAFKAYQDGYRGAVPEGATGYTKLANGDFQFTMSDGTKQTYTEDGKLVEAK